MTTITEGRKKTSIERNKPTTNNNKNTEIYNMTTVAPKGHKNIQKIPLLEI